MGFLAPLLADVERVGRPAFSAVCLGGKKRWMPATVNERALRDGYLQFLPRLAKAHLRVLRAASATLGWDFGEDEWEVFAREYDLPVASTFARAAGGGSFALAKFLADVGPLPPHPGGSRFQAQRRIGGWTQERLLLGAMTVARTNGGWPARARFDDAARKARARGVDVPLIDVVLRRLGLTYTELRRAASRLVSEIESAGPGDGVPNTYERADGVALGMALGVELLGYRRPSSDVWDDSTRAYRSRGVPSLQTIARAFGGWHAGWGHVEKLGLDPGVQSDPRPRYTLEGIARGMALAEARLGHRPSPSAWTDDVRELKLEVGAGVIPAKPTIYYYFRTWNEAWAFVDILRAQGVI